MQFSVIWRITTRRNFLSRIGLILPPHPHFSNPSARKLDMNRQLTYPPPLFHSSRPAVVMVYAAQNRERDHAARRMVRWRDNVDWCRDALVQTLMRARLIEEPTIVVNHPSDLLIAQNQDMVQTFTPDCADESFAERVGFGGIGRGVDELEP